MLLSPLLIAAVQAGSFAPPLGQPLRVVTERVEGEAAERRGHRIERLVRFARDHDGYRAEVLLVKAEADDPRNAQGMFEAGYAGLAGRTMVFRLDAAGKVAAIDDRDAHWQAFCRGTAAMVAAKRDRPPAAEMAELAQRVTAPLCALPIERRHAALASLVAPLIAEEAAEPPGTRPVRMPGTSPFGGPVTLEGTRTIAAEGLLVRSVTRASADVSGESGPGHVEIEMARDVDPLTGLLANGTETVRTAADGRATERVTTVRVRLEPASAWP